MALGVFAALCNTAAGSGRSRRSVAAGRVTQASSCERFERFSTACFRLARVESISFPSSWQELQPIADCENQAQAMCKPIRNWSSGAAHSSATKLGIFNSKLRAAAQMTAVIEDEKTDLVRNVFGTWSASCTGAGISSSQNLALFQDPHGTVNAFDFSSQGHQSMSRQKAIGICSHVTLQSSALCSFLESKRVMNAVVACFAFFVSNFVLLHS